MKTRKSAVYRIILESQARFLNIAYLSSGSKAGKNACLSIISSESFKITMFMEANSVSQVIH